MDRADLLDNLGSKYDGVKFKIIEHIGECSYIFSVDMGSVALKIQIPRDYPCSEPLYHVRGVSNNRILIEDELIHLQRPPLQELLFSATEILLKYQVKTVGKGSTTAKADYKKNASSAFTEDLTQNVKLPPMRTAADVIKRVQWDSMLDESDFIVGYLDRFIGTIERPFTEFTWEKESLTETDPSVLTIPQHRIQFFKHKGVIVWDKSNRVDYIFGSTGAELTMFDEKWHEGKINSRSNDDVAGAQLSPAKTTDERHEPKANWSKRPSHFLAILIDNRFILQQISELQTVVCSSQPALAKYLVPLSAIHITLFTIVFDDDNAAADVTDTLFPATRDDFLTDEQMQISLQGVDILNDRVLCIPFQAAKFLNVVDTLKNKFGRYVNRKDVERKFLGHVTVAKLTHGAMREDQQSLQAAVANLASAWNSYDFGSFIVDAVHLCNMKPVYSSTLPDKSHDSGSSVEFSYPVIRSIKLNK